MSEAAQIMTWLAAERARRGLTQAAIAQRMGTSQSYVAKIEAAHNDPRLSTFLRYIGALGLTPRFLGSLLQSALEGAR